MGSLREYLAETVPTYWKEKKQPFLLSIIGSQFTKEEIRLETKGLSVVNWIKENPDLGYKIISDPSNRARIGMIPSSEHFQYSTVTAINHNVSNGSFSESDREITLKFLELLQQRCTFKELQEINIPISILMKLL